MRLSVPVAVLATQTEPSAAARPVAWPPTCTVRIRPAGPTALTWPVPSVTHRPSPAVARWVGGPGRVTTVLTRLRVRLIRDTVWAAGSATQRPPSPAVITPAVGLMVTAALRRPVLAA